MDSVILCKCNELIVKSNGSETKIRGKVLILKSNGAFSVCKSCGYEVQVPLKIDDEVMKSLAQAKNPSLFVKR